MSQSNTSRERSLAKGIAAGLIAGLVGVVAKTIAERMFPPRTHGEPASPQALDQKVAGHDLVPAAAEGIHWSFGAATGAAYGALAEFYPAAAAKEGAAFGMALETLTHETALPALGIALPIGNQTTRERVSEMTSHVIYGLTVEFVRRTVRRLL